MLVPFHGMPHPSGRGPVQGLHVAVLEILRIEAHVIDRAVASHDMTGLITAARLKGRRLGRRGRAKGATARLELAIHPDFGLAGAIRAYRDMRPGPEIRRKIEVDGAITARIIPGAILP